MAPAQETIGFVGVGRMGANMARRLKDVGRTIVGVCDIDQRQCQSVAEELGCQALATPAQLAEKANVVFTVVSDDDSMRTIYAVDHPDSLLAHATDRLFINCATISPPIHVEVQTLVEQHGGQSLEACMASSIPQAREGTLYLMCAGKPEVFERAQSLLSLLSAQVRFIGPAGEAAKVKALVNMVMNMNTAALAEGLGLGAALGLDITMLREVFGQTGAASRVLQTDGEDMIKRDHECYFSAAHAAKDSGIAYSLAGPTGLHLPLAKATWEQYRRLVEAGKGELDKSGVAELTFRDRQQSSHP